MAGGFAKVGATLSMKGLTRSLDYMLFGDFVGEAEDCSTMSDNLIFLDRGSPGLSLFAELFELAWSANCRSRSLTRRLSSSSRRCASSRDRRRRASESRTIISDRRAVASLYSSSATRPRKSPLMSSSSLTRVFNDAFAARSPSYVCGASA